MKTFYTTLIILSILAVIMISGCTTSKHYDDHGVSFNYPANWQVGDIYDLPGAVVGVSENSQVDVKILKRNIPADSNLESLYNQSVSNQTNSFNKYCYQQLSSKKITVDGQVAYENIYQLGCNSTQTRQKIREVWLEKNGHIYIISCTSIPPEIYSNKSRYFDIIISSFHVN